MSIYVYKNNSLIDEVAILTSETGIERAYLHAGSAASVVGLAKAKAAMVEQGWQCVPVTYLGRPTLEVRGFGKQDKLCKFLADQQITNGVSRHFPTPDQEISLSDKFRKRSLQASGMFYLVGDTNFFLYGLKEAHWEEMLAGIAYAVGTSSIAGFGRNDQSDLQIKDVSRRMLRHAMQKSVQLPEDSAIANIAEEHPKKGLDSTVETLRRYPSEIFCAFTGLAGLMVASAALRHKVLIKPPAHYDPRAIRDMRFEGWCDVGLGTVTMASTALGGLITEKHRDPDEPAPTDMVGKVWEWVREKPLRLTGYGLMISTLCHAGSTYKAWRNAHHTGDLKRLESVPYRAAFIGANLIAEFLMAISSKGHGEGVKSDSSVDESCFAIAADLISRQPPSAQAGLVEYMADYLGRPEVFGGEKAEIVKQLNEQLRGLQVNPWGGGRTIPEAPTSGSENKSWQHRLNQPTASPDQGFYI